MFKKDATELSTDPVVSDSRYEGLGLWKAWVVIISEGILLFLLIDISFNWRSYVQVDDNVFSLLFVQELQSQSCLKLEVIGDGLLAAFDLEVGDLAEKEEEGDDDADAQQDEQNFRLEKAQQIHIVLT